MVPGMGSRGDRGMWDKKCGILEDENFSCNLELRKAKAGVVRVPELPGQSRQEKREDGLCNLKRGVPSRAARLPTSYLTSFLEFFSGPTPSYLVKDLPLEGGYSSYPGAAVFGQDSSACLSVFPLRA